jgi:predicted PurR-regulated permease PerM
MIVKSTSQRASWPRMFRQVFRVTKLTIHNRVIVPLGTKPKNFDLFASLCFLIAIHKLEYFLNAHPIGNQIHAHAWELLLAMLVMEATFGVPGLVAVPIYYAYLKDELTVHELV